MIGFLCLIIPYIICFIILSLLKKKENENKVKQIFDVIYHYLNNCENSETISQFSNDWNIIESKKEELLSFQNKRISNNTKEQIQRFYDKLPAKTSEDYQWYLRNAIDRQKETTIKSIKTTYKNSQTYKQAEYDAFCSDIHQYSADFNEETNDFANSCIDEVSYALGGVSGRRMPAQDDYASYQRSLLTPSLRYDILKRDGFRCTICGRGQEDGVKLHVDHIKPVSKGGETTPSNLRTLCQDCNLGKSDKYDEESEN